MNKQYLDKLEALDRQIGNTIVDETGDSKVVLDGIVNLEDYLKANYKILWILKEARCDSGGWDMREALRNMYQDKRKGWRYTFNKIIYTSYGLLNNFILWDGMDYIRDNPSMKKVLNSIAYINLKKLPNIKDDTYASNNNEIYEAYLQYKSIILSQISLFDPDIIIGANTLHHILRDLEMESSTTISYNSIQYYSTDNRLYINAKHPSYLGVCEVDYCDDIITSAKNWASINRKSVI